MIPVVLVLSMTASAGSVLLFAMFKIGRSFERRIYELEDRTARLRDCMNKRDGTVQTIPLTVEQREALTVRGPLPVAKVVRR